MIAWVGEWVAHAPLLLIAAVLVSGMILAAVLGSYLRRKHDREGRGASKEDDDTQEGYIVSAVLGLLALLVGFTFAMAIDRYDTRRGRVLEEANAIGTTYLRAQLLEEPHRARISHLLVEYTDLRIALGEQPPGPEQTALLAKNQALITDLWTATVAAFPAMRQYDISSAFVESMNQVIDLDAARQHARQSRVPAEVYLILFGYYIIAAGVMGYVLVGRRGRQTAAFLLFLFGVSLMLVIDIDRPMTGGIIESQEPMKQLRASLAAQPPAVFDRFTTKAVGTEP